MATLTANDNLTLRVESGTIDATIMGPERDPDWRYIDAAGHGHFHDRGYPTLHEVTETRYDEDDGEEWQAHVRWECPHCGEHIVPGTRASMGRSSIPAGKRYYVLDEEVDRDTFLAAWRPMAEQQLAEQEAAI